ncbi:hypothetical protein GOV14_00330 [Candidatus Pacearchaeota archaeon]|nr:hypothetical protein [Candidatus Pacearchaeota archaeon]
MMNNKRGVSPLAITIVLIALAVSIGAVIMNLGGIYVKKIQSQDLECKKVFINSFELEKTPQCKNIQFDPIVYFFLNNQTENDIQCYQRSLIGKGDICLTSEILFNYGWTPVEKR